MQTIGILEDNITLRETIEEHLETKGNYKIFFSSGSYSKILELNKLNTIHQPDFILLDIHLEDILGIYAIPKIKEKFPKTHIIIITGDKDKSLLLKAFQLGASGYMIKPFSMAYLELAIERIQLNGSFMDPDTTTKLLHELIDSDKPIFLMQANLSKEEKEVIRYLKKGMSNKEIANIMDITARKVQKHIYNICFTLDIPNEIELIKKYLM